MSHPAVPGRANDRGVFLASVLVIGVFLAAGLVAPSALGKAIDQVQSFLLGNFAWLYLMSVAAFLVFAVWLGFSRYGSVKLGKPDDKPEYSNLAWFAMLFACGMGIGLVFWSIAEPMYHYMGPPFGTANSPEAVSIAMRYTFFHWGLHPWAIYIVVGLALAYFGFAKGLPFCISSTLYPLLGDKTFGPIGKAANVLAVFATLFGCATSLGLGSMQINGGLNLLYGVPVGTVSQILIIAVITSIAVTSVLTGINRGIRFLSNVNMILAAFTMVFLFVFGPTRFILNLFTETLGDYLQNLVRTSLWTDVLNGSQWIGWWTVFYWAWWIAWAPFVGSFIARISKGRTIREFVVGVLLLPTAFSFIWLSIYAGNAFHLELTGQAQVASAVAQDITSALFVTLAQLPFPSIISFLAMILIAIFFITSSDSATFVVAMHVSGGNLEPPQNVKGFWGVLEGAVAAVLLLAGGLGALQTASIASAFPFMLVMLAMCYALIKALRKDVDEHGYTG